MNLFTQYGIKEVANVMIYSIKRIGDEEFYMPVLFLDTLKISDVEKKEQKVTAQGGYGNAKIISWSFGKDITLKMQDALFTPASLSMCWGGWLEGDLQVLGSLIAKITIRNKYKKNNYSIYAYPSPEITAEEWEVLYSLCDGCYVLDVYTKDVEYIEEHRVKLRKSYYRLFDDDDYEDFWNGIVIRLMLSITNEKQNLFTKVNNIETIERIEKCIVQDRDLVIDYEEQKRNYQYYLTNDYSHTYTLFLDDRTMLPLYFNGGSILKKGTSYLKLTRERYIPKTIYNSPYGKELIITPDTFPDYYRIVGETNIRERLTGQDQRFQFTITKAKLSGDTNIKLEATGEPTVFDMNVDVICPENDVMFELKQFEVEEDCTYGGTHIVPQNVEYTSTKVFDKKDIDYVEDNTEIY